jgi:hypothetical protein
VPDHGSWEPGASHGAEWRVPGRSSPPRVAIRSGECRGTGKRRLAGAGPELSAVSSCALPWGLPDGAPGIRRREPPDLRPAITNSRRVVASGSLGNVPHMIRGARSD